jgi:glycosyltransferase involved in cell wall biosynthesis
MPWQAHAALLPAAISMKKLAVVVDTFPRWSERFIARELRELLRQQVDLTVFCLKAGTLPQEDPEWDGLIERRVVLPSCLIPGGAKSTDSAETRQRIQAVKDLLGIRAGSRIGCAQKFGTLLHEGKFRHVHAHFASLPSTMGWLAAGLAGIPFSMSAHARDVFVEPQLLKEKCADATAVFTCHARAQELLQTMTSKATLMPHGLPLDSFPFKNRIVRRKSTVRVIAAGRFVPKKGFATLLDAVAQPFLKEKDFQLRLIGEGPEESRIHKRIKSLSLQDKVSLIAPLYGAALRDEFNAADLLIAPYQQASDGDVDGVPNIVLEAFARGVPVIGTDAGSLGEVLTPATGTVVPAGDSAALAQAIASFIEDSVDSLARVGEARQMIEDRYDIRRNIGPLIKLLQS